MNDPGPREWENLLRQALNDAAARIHPAGDGLERVRARVTRRRRRLGWMRPVLAMATATVLVGLATTVPLYLRSTGSGEHSSVLGSASERPQEVTATGTRSAQPPAPTPLVSGGPMSLSATPAPAATDAALPDMVTVWPYGSRREGSVRADQDVADHVHPGLRDPRQTALEFIRSFVGTTDPLVADQDVPLAAGIGVTVSRKADDGSQRPVSLVYLVRVRKGDDSPYVVVEASTPARAGATDVMSVQPGALEDVSPITVTGTVIPPASVPEVAAVHVELREPGQDQTLASQSPALSPDSEQTPQEAWIATLTPIRPLSTPTGTVAAWTVDAQDHLLAFVAAPTPLPGHTPDPSSPSTR